MDTSYLTTCCCLLSLTLQTGGAAGLEAHLAGEAEAAKPEYLRQRPKYYYYFEWMKKRILAQASGMRLVAVVAGKVCIVGYGVAQAA